MQGNYDCVILRHVAMIADGWAGMRWEGMGAAERDDRRGRMGGWTENRRGGMNREAHVLGIAIR